MSELFIGLMSGTSMDAVDAVLIDLGGDQIRRLEVIDHPFPTPLRRELLSLCEGGGPDELERLAQLDIRVGHLFADAVIALLRRAGVRAAQVCAIGSHGQTVRHRPGAAVPYTVQIGDPNTIAERTGITTVADFRRRDLAAGGQGAPLVPAFHAAMLRTDAEDTVVLNLGGMANITLLPRDPDLPVSGFDTGPGNVLLDEWAGKHLGRRRDDAGQWAAGGKVHEGLLARLLREPYFRRPPPKSTGREHFNREWLRRRLKEPSPGPRDVQATLSALTARTVADAIGQHAPGCRRVLTCGGGVHNTDLMKRLRRHLGECTLESTAVRGLDPDWVEAMAFGWLAARTLAGQPGNVPTVTGASRAVILGGIYPGSDTAS